MEAPNISVGRRRGCMDCLVLRLTGLVYWVLEPLPEERLCADSFFSWLLSSGGQSFDGVA